MKISIFRQQKRFKVWMAGEFNAEKIMGFSLMPVGTLIYMRNCRYFRIIAICSGADDNPAKLAKMVEVIDCFQLLVINPVNAGNGFNEKVLVAENFGCLRDLTRRQINIKVITLGLVISFFRSRRR